ncbi:MAG: rod shape-determining protein RodA [Candidatus Aminicenantes bacterium]|nr:rod shape-determining protein RodA [Candidatus Aminicenantes bacterium]
MIDQTQFKNIDWALIVLLIINTLIGIAIIYSSSHYLPGNYHLKQFLWMVLSLVALFIFLYLDYNVLATYSLYFYIICLSLLVLILIFGKLIAGAKSWIKFDFFQIQPSEITKIAIILLLARVFSDFKAAHILSREGILSGILVALPVSLVAFQPDLGTALSYLPILMAAFILAGINKKTILIILVAALILITLGYGFLLKDYQKERIKTLIFPGHDPLGSGYQVLQSKIAIGSGGLLGKGYLNGSQSQLRFLPARHTDFIFAVIGEELGFVGVVVIAVFYFLFLARLFQSVGTARDRTGVYIIFMAAVMIASQFFINVFMTIGFFPIAGIPLPLLSYGGSSLLTNFLAVSLVLNVKMRRFVNV